jgi:BirA family transcriptional regulator, biotin operon repressor / biotin---[acetyl-CoA-carboxylase] ligase
MKIGREIIHLDSVDSTSNYVANLLRKGELDHGTVILADEQFAGKGQRNANWSVKPGENLTFSLFIDNVNLSVENQFYLTQVVSLSLIDLLTLFGMQVEIKWPNDIFCKGKKIAGVLIENQLAGNTIKSSIIGVGLNINQEQFEGFSATSTLLETGQHRKPIDVLYGFIDAFGKVYSKCDWPAIKRTYLDNLYLMGVSARFEDQSGLFIGVIKDVLDSGELVVVCEGKERYYELKELKFIQ